MATKAEKSAALLERVQAIAPGFYTECDGGDWYVCPPMKSDIWGRIAEGFDSRDDAHKCLAWLAGDPMPKGWKIVKCNDLACDLECGQGYEATIWTREACKAFPARADELVQP